MVFFNFICILGKKQDMEEWRKIEEYPNYEVSSYGNFRRKNYKKEIKGCVKKGYKIISLGRGKTKALHIMVAKVFPEICGEWFDGCQVHHKNFNKLDNRAENLVVLSNKEHQRLHYKETAPNTFKRATEKRSLSIKKALKGRRAVERHISVLQIDKNGCFIKIWDCGADISKELNISQGNISSCCEGKLKTAYGYVWKYNNTENYLVSILNKSFIERGLKTRRSA